jgi:hypothetical protein
MLVVPLLGVAEAPSRGWTRVGEPAAVAIDPDHSTIRLSVTDDRSIAGGLSNGTVSVAGGAVLITAEVAGAPEGGVTFALVDAGTGDSLAHWRSTRAIDAPTRVAAVLETTPTSQPARVFVGTHRAPSSGEVSDIQFTATRKNVNVLTASYGALVDADRTAGQVFRATGRKLDAVAFRIRQLNADQSNGPDLRVALYAWHASKGRGDRPLAERLLPRALIPPVGSTGEIEVTVAFGTALTAGREYLVEWSPAGPCAPPEAFLLYGGDDRYPHGFRCENGGATPDRWDLYLQTFESQ